MKKVVLVLLLIVSVLLVGCGGVSQEEYDKLEKEKDKLSEELKGQKEKYADLNEKYCQKADEEVQKGFELAAPAGWAQTYFGKDCLVFSADAEYVQIISKESYIATSEEIQTIYKKVLESMQGLTYVLDNWGMKYERIGVRFQQANGKELIEFVFKKDGQTYVLESVAGDLQNSSIINATFNNMF